MSSRALPPFSLAVGVAVGAALIACSGDGRPPSSDQFGEVQPPRASSQAGEGTGAGLGHDEPTLADAGEAGAGESCKPRTKRECVMKFRGPDGTIIDCKDSFQFCRADGNGWHPCGFFRTGPSGEQLPPE